MTAVGMSLFRCLFDHVGFRFFDFNYSDVNVIIPPKQTLHGLAHSIQIYLFLDDKKDQHYELVFKALF